MRKFTLFVLIFSVLLMITGCTPKQQTNDISQYNNYLQEVTYADSYMPTESEFGAYSSIQITNQRTIIIPFETDVIGVFLSYNESDYQTQKAYISSHYSFYQPGEEGLVTDPDADINGYHIRLVKEDYDLPTCKMGLLIGTDDAAQKICYLFYYDPDLDTLSDLDDFVADYTYFPQ